MQFCKIFLGIIFCMLCAVAVVCEDDFRAESFFYTFNGNSGKFEFCEIYKNFGDLAKKQALVDTLLGRIARLFSMEIQSGYMYYKDADANLLTGCIVDIRLKESAKLFNWEGHGSYIIEMICLNVLQPNTNKWGIDFLVLKINGIFASCLDMDAVYPAILTAEQFDDEELFDWSTYPPELLK